MINTMRQELEQAIAGVCKDLFNVDVKVDLTRPDEQFGDYATNVALQLSKQLGKNPREVAQAIKDALKHVAVTEITVAGPGFLNLRVSSEALAQSVINEARAGTIGQSKIGTGKTVVAEFPSPNMAKPLSVGHLRSATQGWSIYKLMQHMGYKVISDNHVGDHGTPYGKWVVGFLRYSSDEQLAERGIYELSRIYIQMTNDLKTEKEAGGHALADEVQSWLKKLEAGDPDAVSYSTRFKQISLDHLHNVMERLRISTEFELGEAFYVPRGQELADELLQKKVAEMSDGAVIVRLDKQGIETPVMLRKANGSALYATSDLATIEYREKTWAPEKVFIHTGQEQAFYFRQLKTLSQEAGYKDVIEHLWHGLVDQKDETGKRQKMSSRKGVVLLEELLDVAEAQARGQMKEGDEEDVKAVALGAIKFADFMADRKNGLLFDWDTMFSVQGFSGPAVQYSVVRIKSILAKAEATEPEEGYEWHAEHKLLLAVSSYTDLLLELHDNYELHKLANYLYALAREFNRYYEETRILDAKQPDRSCRLWFIALIKYVMEDGLDILGIPAPERM